MHLSGALNVGEHSLQSYILKFLLFFYVVGVQFEVSNSLFYVETDFDVEEGKSISSPF